MSWLINGEINGTLSPHDRGLAYGDGVFRTLKVRDRRPVWWPDHYAKLGHDCAALQLKCPSEKILLDDIARVTQAQHDGVIKIIITRGEGARGYAPPQRAAPTRIVISSSMPELLTGSGVRVRWCSLRLARQSQLGGVKHLNRLENVLARAEWSDPAIAEGLLCDDTGAVIGGTRSNIFVMHGERLLTPDVSLSGVAGVTRDRVLRAAARHRIDTQVARLEPANILDADEVFLSNSVRGLTAVAQLEHTPWGATKWSEQFQQWIDETD